MLDQFVYIRKELKQKPQVSPSEIKGSVGVTKDVFDYLQHLAMGNCIDDHLQVNGKNIAIDNLDIGTKALVTLFPNEISDGFYFEKISELISLYSQEPPDKRFYVFELDYFSDAPNPPPKISAYNDILCLIAILSKISDYEKSVGNAKELVFFQNKKLVLETTFGEKDLVLLPDIEVFQSQLTTTHDKVERQKIFVNEITGLLLKIDNPGIRFRELLANFDDVFGGYQKSHAFYLEQFSFEKIKSELDDQKLSLIHI